MKLYDFMKNFTSVSEDSSDNTWDCSVTIEYDNSFENNTDAYYVFCVQLYKTVEFDKVNEYGVWIVNYNDMIQNNLDLFKSWAKENWASDITDWDDEQVIYEWVQSIHYYLAGYLNDRLYRSMIELLKKCK